MSWTQILEPTRTTSEIIHVSQPFTIRAEGTFGSRTLMVESARRGSNIWNPVDLDGQLVATNPQVTFGSNPDTAYRVTVSAAGLSVFWNIAYPVQGG